MVTRQCFHCGQPLQCKPYKAKKPRLFCSQLCYLNDKNAQALARFWTRVHKTPTCWLWTGPVNTQGYGQARFLIGTKPVNKAHRIAWVLHHGHLLLPGLDVLHRCDVPGCVNPSHLFLGTDKDNSEDAIKKGRVQLSRPGELASNVQLTWEEIDLIRRRAAEGQPQRAIARQFGVSQNNIWKVIHHKTWKEEHRPA